MGVKNDETNAVDETSTQNDDLGDAPVEASYEEGDKTDVSGANRRLLDRLLYKGVLPRYAFPTDVATFHVFDENRSSSYETAFKHTPSQSLTVALSQYAPGREVVIGGTRYVSGAIYSRMRRDLFEAWGNRRLYAECEVCGYARTHELDEEGVERGAYDSCPACKSEGSYGPYQLWMRPPGFAHPVDVEEETSSDRFQARTYATHAKLSAPSPTEEDRWSPVSQGLRCHTTRKHLLVTNRGPRERGYNYCVRCGRIEPTALVSGTVLSEHRKPYPETDEPQCKGASTTGLVLGTEFITDILLISLQVSDPVRLYPGTLETGVALRTISEALTLATCDLLEIEQGEVQAEFRPAMTSAGEKGLEAEIYMYDSLSGGAGFSRQAGQLGEELFRKTLNKLENCPNDCDSSCYGCLRSFRNRRAHAYLDRFVGSSLLRHVLDGGLPELSEERIHQSTRKLSEDLRRQIDSDSINIYDYKTVHIDGIGDIIAPVLIENERRSTYYVASVRHPLIKPEFIQDEKLNEAAEFASDVTVLEPTNEIIVRKNLPRATSQLLETIDEAIE